MRVGDARNAVSVLGVSGVWQVQDGTLAQLAGVQAAHHDGYDELTFQFVAPVTGAALQNLPAYTVTHQSSAGFTKDASGEHVTLDGTAGLRVVMQGSSGFDNLASTPVQTYTGSTDLHVQLPEVRELAQTGDFERVLSWGVGLRTGACYRVRELTDPARLVIDVTTG